MQIYHEASESSLPSILSRGIRRSDRGEKGQDDAIIKTDELLDLLRPAALKEAGISRSNNIYGYVGDDETVVSITSGELLPIHKKATGSGVLLRLNVDMDRCWVSDLDAFDTVMQAIEHTASNEQRASLARGYWERLVPLRHYRWGQLRRPEVMITYDLAPESIRQV